MDRRGFLETGGFWNGRAGRRHGLRRRGLAARALRGHPAFRTLGRTGMKITIVSMGAMRTSEPAIFQAAFDKGVNYIDTARGYMDGRNEGMVGEALKGYRDRVYVATKVKPGSKEANDPEHRRKSFLAEGGLRGPAAVACAQQRRAGDEHRVPRGAGRGQEVGKDAVHRRDHAFQRA